MSVATLPPLELPLDRPPAWRTWQRRVGRPLFISVEVLAFLLFWQAAVESFGWLNRAFFPAPGAIFGSFLTLAGSGVLWPSLAYSLTNFAVGYLLAAGSGVALGLLLGSSRLLALLVGPLVVSLYAMPHVAIRPITFVWFGFGPGPVIFLVFLSAFFPVVLNTMAGVQTVDRSLVRAARVFGARGLDVYVKVVLPATVPFVLTGLRLAAVAGFIGLLVAELVGTSRGMGALVAVASSQFKTSEALAAVAVVVATSVTLVRLLGVLEDRASSWRVRP